MSKTSSTRPWGSRPGPRPRIDLPSVVAAGLTHDLSTLTISDIARDLGVTHPAIYRYVGSSHDLLMECLAEIMRTTEWPAAEGSWQDQLLGFANGLWAVCEAHPGLAQVMYSVPEAPPTGHEQMERVVRGLVHAGLRPDLAFLAVDFVGDTVFATRIGCTARRGAEVPMVPDENFGLLAEAAAALTEQVPRTTEDSLLPLKLELIIEAIEQRSLRNTSADSAQGAG